MDQIVIDITDIPEPMARVGSEVELIGTDPAAPNHLPTLARNAGLISHAMMCAVSPRLPRSYVSETGSDEPIIVARTVGAAGAGRSIPARRTDNPRRRLTTIPTNHHIVHITPCGSASRSTPQTSSRTRAPAPAPSSGPTPAPRPRPTATAA